MINTERIRLWQIILVSAVLIFCKAYIDYNPPFSFASYLAGAVVLIGTWIWLYMVLLYARMMRSAWVEKEANAERTRAEARGLDAFTLSAITIQKLTPEQLRVLGAEMLSRIGDQEAAAEWLKSLDVDVEQYITIDGIPIRRSIAHQVIDNAKQDKDLQLLPVGRYSEGPERYMAQAIHRKALREHVAIPGSSNKSTQFKSQLAMREFETELFRS